jgi:feruloyl esterase
MHLAVVVNEARERHPWPWIPSTTVSLSISPIRELSSYPLRLVLAAMVNWVENGQAPTEFVAAKYTNNNVTQGVQFTRKLCPVSRPKCEQFILTLTSCSDFQYPQKGEYQGGDPNSSDSFKCM